MARAVPPATALSLEATVVLLEVTEVHPASAFRATEPRQATVPPAIQHKDTELATVAKALEEDPGMVPPMPTVAQVITVLEHTVDMVVRATVATEVMAPTEREQLDNASVTVTIEDF